MNPQALQLHTFLLGWAVDYDTPSDNPKRASQRTEFARLLRAAAAAVEREGQVLAPISEAAE